MSGVGALEPFYSTAFAEVGDFLRLYADGPTFSEPASAVHDLVECLPELLPLVQHASKLHPEAAVGEGVQSLDLFNLAPHIGKSGGVVNTSHFPTPQPSPGQLNIVGVCRPSEVESCHGLGHIVHSLISWCLVRVSQPYIFYVELRQVPQSRLTNSQLGPCSPEGQPCC